MASPLIVGPQKTSAPEGAAPAASAIAEIGDLLRDFYKRSIRLMDRRMADASVSFSRARLLMTIAREGRRLRSTDLATFLDVTPRTVTEAIDGLERDGLLRREPDPEDRRAKWIVLTASGEAAVDASEAIKVRQMHDIFGTLEPAEQAEMIRLLTKLNIRLETLAGA